MDGLVPIESMLFAEMPQWLVTAISSWWPIYMPYPGHFGVAGVQGDPIHIKEHFQANQRAN